MSEDKENSKYTQREFSINNFKKTFALPEHMNLDKVKADYRNGILYIDLPLDQEAQAKVRRTIKVA